MLESQSLFGGLCKATESVCWLAFEAALFKSAFSLAFFAALRISELVPLIKHKQGGLKMEDLYHTVQN